ncbi:MAG: DUF4426 domain-containing protein [Arenimonas sp.]
MKTLSKFPGFVFLLLMFASHSCFAQFLKSGDIRIYANAMVSSQLNADMARQYGITRSASRVLLHVVVREGIPGKDKTLPATITAVAVRKNGERSNINMQITSEGQDIYYLGELNISKNEAINFEISTQVEKQKPMRMTFFQEFLASDFINGPPRSGQFRQGQL